MNVDFVEMITNFTSFPVKPILALSIVPVFWRLVKGPDLSDRIVALDVLSSIAVAIMVAYSISTGQTVFLDIALVVALIAFLGTIGFAFYIDKRR